MPDHALIATVAVGLSCAFVGGLFALRVGLPPLVGYLLAGVVVGPFTPGFVADGPIAAELSEIGIVFLMFGVGMHFSVGDLLAVRKVAVPGAILQMLLATLMGMALAHFWGWPWGAGLVFGLSLSVASTVVLLRALEARNLLNTEDGQIAVGWLIVEDLLLIVILVLLPALAGPLGGTNATPSEHSLPLELAITLGKVAAFIAVMLFGAKRVFPWILTRAQATGSRELFTLAVVALSLGVAFGAYKLFGVKFALGAFFAGLVVHESDLSQRAETELRPLQDVFAGLFFVSVGMLFDPSVLIRQPLQVAAVVAIIVVGKAIAAVGIVLLLKKPLSTALTVGAALAQIGEFSFILVSLGQTFGILDGQAVSLVVAGAIVSIVLNSGLFYLVSRRVT
jgi:monovalent cation:H+ antiporter-2, CPA2 family